MTPWARMHLAIAVIWLSAAADGFADPGPPLDMPQTFWAAWKDGDPGLIPERLIIEWPSTLVGSGRFGTPCDRMHSAKPTPGEAWVDALLLVVVGLLEDPQPATTSTPDTTTTALSTRPQARWNGMTIRRVIPSLR